MLIVALLGQKSLLKFLKKTGLKNDGKHDKMYMYHKYQSCTQPGLKSLINHDM